MDLPSQYGIWSLVPPLLAVILAFVTREAVFALLVACIAGVAVLGEGLIGFPELLQRALGDPDFVWVALVELTIGILVAFLLSTGSVRQFTRLMEGRLTSPRSVQMFGWLVGMMVFFSDYFSPLLTGPVLRDLTDRARISREKLAYICDSTSAPVCVLIPLSAWAVFIAGLLAGIGPIADKGDALNVFIRSIGLNFYAIGAVAMVGLIASEWLPDFGPMKKAEKRAREQGKLLADGALPMMSAELADLPPAEQIAKPRLLLNFALPLSIVTSVALGTFLATGNAMILEAFILATAVLAITLWCQRMPMKDIVAVAMRGIKGVMPAVVLLGLAFCIKTLCDDLGTSHYVIGVCEPWLSPALLPMLAFAVCAFLSFSTGTSWGTYAITIPIFVPMALQFSGGQLDTSVYCTVAAVTGGGVFGDHCSPLSDTTILSSLGAASDHIDHVKTQLPYALSAATVALLGYGILALFH